MLEKQRFLTIAEAAEFLHVSETSLRRWTNSGYLRCFRVGVRGERRFLVEDLLRAEGLPVDDLIGRGLLRIIPPDQAYLLTGRFDAQRMLAFMESAILAALAAGYHRVLLTGEMTWSLPNAPGAGGMMDYEALLNPLVDKYPEVTIVCQYDLRRFDGPSVLDALLTHPSVHVASRQVAGFYGL